MISIAVIFFLNINFITGCSSGCSKGKAVHIISLTNAQQEADKMAQLLHPVSPTQLQQTMDDWERTYTDYFESQNKGAGKLFFDECKKVSIQASEVVKVGRHKTWATILYYRNTLEHLLDALNHAFASPEVRDQAVNETLGIKGGCSANFCPSLRAVQVAPEIEKVKIYLSGIKKMLPQLEAKNKEVSSIAQTALQIGEKAVRTFSCCDAAHVDQNPKEQEALFYVYARSAALFTITLKELSHLTTFTWESLQALAIQPNGIYVDATFGGGGHSKAILAQLNQGKLIAFDQDEDAQAVAKSWKNPQFTFIRANARFMQHFLAYHQIEQVDGILADLGVSSHQIDTAHRGFSTRAEGPLDMRMDLSNTLTASHIVNTYSFEDLTQLFRAYGELHAAPALAKALIAAREKHPITTTQNLKDVALRFTPPHKSAKFLAQVFQALRIEVNDELGALKSLLEQSLPLLKTGGRLVVISYHSLEDRLVKRFVKTGNFAGELEKDWYGNPLQQLLPINNKAIIPSASEIMANPRARSAKLRVGERTGSVHFYLYTPSIMMLLRLNFDIIILGLFLLINLVIGLLSSKRISSLREYAIGRKDFSTATLIATIVVSWIGSCGACICLFLVGILAVRMREFLKNISVADAMGSLYGKKVQIVTAISGVLCVLTIVAIEFKVIIRIIGLIFHTEGSVWLAVLVAGVVIFYSVFGGIRAITFTDVVQFFTFGMFIPTLALVIWNQIKDPQQVLTLLNTNPHFSWSQVVGWHPEFITSLGVFLWFIIPALDPAIFQRISMARDVYQARKSFNYAALISLAVCCFLAWIAILSLASNPHLDAHNLFDYIINNYATGGLRGLIGIGILSLAMSTADSYLHASAILLTNDIAKPLGIQFKNEVNVARILCGLTGIFALFLAFHLKDLLTPLQMANRFYMPVVTVPLLLAILGFRSSPASVLTGMGIGFATAISWPFIFKTTDGIIPGVIANLISMVATHYLLKQPGGWIGVREPAPLLTAREKRKEFLKHLKKEVTSFNLSNYLYKTIPSQDYVVAILGVYIIAATYASFYTVPEVVQQRYSGLYHIIGQSVLFISTGFLTYPLWPAVFKSKWLITWAWPLSTFYSLFVVGTWLVFMSDFHLFQAMIFLLSVMMGFLLFPGALMSFMIVAGILLAAYIFNWYAPLPIFLISEWDTLKFKILYGLLLLSNFIGLFKYQNAQGKLVNRNEILKILQESSNAYFQEILKNREHFIHTLATHCVEGFHWLHKQGKSLLASLSAQERTIPYQHLIKEAEHLLYKQQQAGTYLIQAIYPFRKYLRLQVEEIVLNDFLHNTFNHPKQSSSPFTWQLLTHLTTLHADPLQLQNLLRHSLQTIQQKNSLQTPITLLVKDAQLVYDIYFIPHYTKTLPAIQFIFTTATSPHSGYSAPVSIFLPHHTSKPDGGIHEQIIEAHYGMASWEEEDRHITQICVLPVDVRNVRPALVDECTSIFHKLMEQPTK
eukprot:gene250-330_t